MHNFLLSREFLLFFLYNSQKGVFLLFKIMKISEYYIDKAKYKAIDEDGNLIWLEVDYWNNKFKLSKKNKELENFATNLLSKKHQVNLWIK